MHYTHSGIYGNVNICLCMIYKYIYLQILLYIHTQKNILQNTASKFYIFFPKAALKATKSL